jgi:CHASE1-domain containing sensor protein
MTEKSSRFSRVTRRTVSANPLSVAFWRPGMAWVVLALGLAATAVGWGLLQSQLKKRHVARFQSHIEKVEQQIRERMVSYEQALKGAAGLFAASASVERGEWAAYVASLNINKYYRGLQALGFVAHVSTANLESFVESNRVDRAPDFDVYPRGVRSNYYVVKYIEPEKGHRAALGYDVATDPNYREAAERSRDSGEAMLTRRIRLLPEVEERPAVALLFPIYRNGMNKNTVSQRRAALDGWVYATFLMEELMDPVRDANDADIDFEIYDAEQIDDGKLLYDADRFLNADKGAKTKALEATHLFPLQRRKWTLRFTTRPSFGSTDVDTESRMILAGGLSISLLIFGITWSLVSTRQRALSLAQEMTEKFRIQERAVVSSNNGIFITDASQPNNPILYARHGKDYRLHRQRAVRSQCAVPPGRRC